MHAVMNDRRRYFLVELWSIMEKEDDITQACSKSNLTDKVARN